MFGTTYRFVALGALALLLTSVAADSAPQVVQVGLGDYVATIPGTPTSDKVFVPIVPNVLAASDDVVRRKREIRRRTAQVALNPCPGTLQACGLPSGSYECLAVEQELNSCGACLEDGGVDCEAIPHAENVACAIGRCEIHSCTDGFRPSFDKTSCVPVSSHRRLRRRH